jgi:hypothetical protein
MGSGAGYVYELNLFGFWEDTDILTATGSNAGDATGTSVGFSDGVAIVGAIGFDTTAATLEADFNEDGDVDRDDFLLWRTGFSKASGAVKMDGDADNDGDVDGRDFLVWQNQFPSSGGGGTDVGAAFLYELGGPFAATAVPEPATIALLLFAGVGVALRRT